MWKSARLKVAVICILVVCTVWLSASLFQNDREVQLLSFILMKLKLTFFGLFVTTPQDRTLGSSNQESSIEYLSTFQRLNSSMPWLHYYASSPKMLENYFLHGYHAGLGKYHKKFSHSKLAILPFFFDGDDLVRECVAHISFKRGMAVSHQNTMSDRWQWESTVEGLGKFKGKYQLFYGHASMGLCFQNFLKNTVVDPRRDVRKHSPGVGESNVSMIKSPENTKTYSDSTKCGQVLFLQHPVSKAINEYYKMFPKKTLCGNKFSENRHKYDDEGDESDAATNNNGVDFEKDHDDIMKWIQTQGNTIFKHLVFNPQFCVKDFFPKFFVPNNSLHGKDGNTTVSNPDEDSTTSNFSNLNETKHSTGNNFRHEEDVKVQFFENTCDKNMRLFLKHLDMKERKYLVNYVIENLPNWFSMVGLYEDLQKSWQMLNIVHRLPLHECTHESLRTSQSSDNNNSDKNSDGKMHNNNNSRNIASLDKNGQRDRTSAVEDQIIVPTRSKFRSAESTSDISHDFDNNLNFSTNNQIAFQNLREEGHTDNEILKKNYTDESSSEQTETERNFGNRENRQDINKNIAFFSDDRDFVGEHMSVSWLQNNRSPGSKISYFQSEIKFCNRVSDFQKLFQRLNNNAIVQESLALDMEIYKAVKKLYQYQKQMVFNTIKA